jgi:hypothetical protein
MAEPGLYPLTLGEMSDGTPIGFTQMVPIDREISIFLQLTVPPKRLTANTGPEDQNWIAWPNRLPERLGWHLPKPGSVALTLWIYLLW